MATKYLLIADELINECSYLIKTGNHKLPSEDKLCSKYNCSRQTIRSALAVLEQRGIIEKFHGSGSYIKNNDLDLTRNVLIVLRNPNEYIYPEIIREIKTKLSSSNYSIDSLSTNNSYEKEREILKSALTEKPAIIIMEAISNILPSPNIDIIEQLIKEKIQIVFLFTAYQTSKAVPTVCLNDRNAAYKLTVELYNEQPSKIGCIFINDDSRGHERYLGVLDAYRNINSDDDLPITYWYTSSEHMEMLEGKPIFLDSAIQKLKSCNILICQNDEIAYYLKKRLSSNKHPDINIQTIASFENSYYAKQSDGFISVGPAANAISDAVISAIASISKGNPVSPKPIALTIRSK